jgi:CheY-like chemotaxis protein
MQPGKCSSWVLLVDDHDDGRELLGEYLSFNGYTVEGCGSGEEALDLVDKLGSPEAVITDLSLGVMSGSELARTLRTHPETASVPILAVTGYVAFEDPDRLFDEVLVKPVVLPELTAALKRAIKH